MSDAPMFEVVALVVKLLLKALVIVVSLFATYLLMDII
jgi:hypothetical protein